MWVRWCHPERKQLPISPLAGGWKGKDPWELLLLVSAGQAGRARLCKERSEGTRCPGSSRTHPASLEGAETTSLGPPHGLFLLKGREKACSVKSTGPLIATARARVCVCVCVCVCVSHSVVSDSAILWNAACWAPLSTGFSRQEYWIGLPFLSKGDLPDLGVEVLLSCVGTDSSPLNPTGTPSSLRRLSSNCTYCPQGRRDILPCYQ